jgi:glucose-1-phosphate thymidylyltransferase
MGGRTVVAEAIIDACPGMGSGIDALGHESIYETTIGNQSLIELVCQEIAASGVRSARIITTANVRRQLGRMIGGNAWGLEITYVDAGQRSGRQAVLDELDCVLEDSAVVLHPGDRLLRGGLRAMTSRFLGGDVGAVVPALSSADTSSPQEPRAAHGPLVLGPLIRPIVNHLLSSDDEMQDLDSAVLASGLQVARCDVAEAWRYSHATETLLAGNRLVLDALEGDDDLSDRSAGNRLCGRIRIAPSASVSNSVIFGPVSIGEHVIIEDSYIGPFTAIAKDAVITGTELDNSIVLAGAELRHPGSRIEASIIGVGASIIRSFELPRGMHLRLAASSRVALS